MDRWMNWYPRGCPTLPRICFRKSITWIILETKPWSGIWWVFLEGGHNGCPSTARPYPQGKAFLHCQDSYQGSRWWDARGPCGHLAENQGILCEKSRPRWALWPNYLEEAWWCKGSMECHHGPSPLWRGPKVKVFDNGIALQWARSGTHPFVLLCSNYNCALVILIKNVVLRHHGSSRNRAMALNPCSVGWSWSPGNALVIGVLNAHRICVGCWSILPIKGHMARWLSLTYSYVGFAVDLVQAEKKCLVPPKDFINEWLLMYTDISKVITNKSAVPICHRESFKHVSQKVVCLFQEMIGWKQILVARYLQHSPTLPCSPDRIVSLSPGQVHQIDQRANA